MTSVVNGNEMSSDAALNQTFDEGQFRILTDSELDSVSGGSTFEDTAAIAGGIAAIAMGTTAIVVTGGTAGIALGAIGVFGGVSAISSGVSRVVKRWCADF